MNERNFSTYERLLNTAKSLGIPVKPGVFYLSAKLIGLRFEYVNAVIDRLTKDFTKN